MSMYWTERDNTPSTSGSSAGCSTPPTPASDLPSSPPNKNAFVSPTLQSQTTKDVLQSVLKVRKTWKTSRGGETVWPMDLEAALLEGLEKYQPDDSRETRMLGRFPRRNRFISDYIFDKTGKRRSPKQVGSRLQQLRESCGGTQLLQLLSPFRKPDGSGSSASTDSALSSPISPTGDGFFSGPSTSRDVTIYIDILPEGAPDRHRAPTSSPWSEAGDIVHVSDHPRRLEIINPTISFTAPSPVAAYSRFTVCAEAEDILLHAENVPLVLVTDESPQPAGFLYSTQLVPNYWRVIVDSPDPTRFTIFQHVTKNEGSSTLFSATYKFVYPRNTANYSPSSSSVYAAHSTYTGNPVSLSNTRYSSMYDGNASWSAAPSLHHGPDTSPIPMQQKYASQNADHSSSYLFFPPELSSISNYVS
ncbi:TEA domain-containing protein [Favolaschia claudopus]|uniref:TEA domain-containing protein n=1 Tax=Favolaschia claudopus TaxID=2862362 RepID=A0AAW0DTE7_9AGAR